MSKDESWWRFIKKLKQQNQHRIHIRKRTKQLSGNVVDGKFAMRRDGKIAKPLPVEDGCCSLWPVSRDRFFHWSNCSDFVCALQSYTYAYSRPTVLNWHITVHTQYRGCSVMRPTCLYLQSFRQKSPPILELRNFAYCALTSKWISSQRLVFVKQILINCRCSKDAGNIKAFRCLCCCLLLTYYEMPIWFTCMRMYLIPSLDIAFMVVGMYQATSC